MTPNDLRDAALKIRAKAKLLEMVSTGDALRDEQARGVAGQLRDRAWQIESWADRADRTGDVTPDMATCTAEFLAYAGCV
jgi:hypothetical protein